MTDARSVRVRRPNEERERPKLLIRSKPRQRLTAAEVDELLASTADAGADG